MALGKAIFPESLDLIETALRKFRIIPAFGHPPDHLGLQGLDRAARPEGRHGLAQLIGLRRGKLGRINGDLHGLFLKNRHAQRPAEDLQQFILRMLRPRRRIGHPFNPLPPPQERMHHIPLNGPGPHNRHFDHQIIKGARPQLGQHRHLRPALHLKHAQTVPRTKHVIGRRVLRRHRSQIVIHAVMRPHQVKPLGDAGQHAQGKHIHLEDAQRVDVILVPLDKRPLRHRAIADGHDLRQRSFGQDETAHMLAQMPRHARHLLRQLQHPPQVGVRQVKTRLADPLFLHLPLERPPNRARQFRGHILAQPHRLADLPNGRAGPVMNDRGAQPRPLPPVFAIHVLDHFLAPLVLKVHVDVRRLIPLL